MHQQQQRHSKEYDAATWLLTFLRWPLQKKAPILPCDNMYLIRYLEVS